MVALSTSNLSTDAPFSPSPHTLHPARSSVFKSSPWDIPHLQLYPDGTEVSHMNTQPILQRHCLAKGPPEAILSLASSGHPMLPHYHGQWSLRDPRFSPTWCRSLSFQPQSGGTSLKTSPTAVALTGDPLLFQKPLANCSELPSHPQGVLPVPLPRVPSPLPF